MTAEKLQGGSGNAFYHHSAIVYYSAHLDEIGLQGLPKHVTPFQ